MPRNGAWLDDEIEPFLQHLRAARYAYETLQRKRTPRRYVG